MRWSIETVAKNIHKRKNGKVEIYFLSAESIVVAEIRRSIYGDLSNYILLQSWHERNKAPFKRFKRQLQRKDNLTLLDVQIMAAHYNVQITSVSKQIIPECYREPETVFLEPMVIANL